MSGGGLPPGATLPPRPHWPLTASEPLRRSWPGRRRSECRTHPWWEDLAQNDGEFVHFIFLTGRICPLNEMRYEGDFLCFLFLLECVAPRKLKVELGSRHSSFGQAHLLGAHMHSHMQTRAHACEHTGMHIREHTHRPPHASTHRGRASCPEPFIPLPVPSPGPGAPTPRLPPAPPSVRTGRFQRTLGGRLSARRAGSVMCSLTGRRGRPLLMVSVSRVLTTCLRSGKPVCARLTFPGGAAGRTGDTPAPPHPPSLCCLFPDSKQMDFHQVLFFSKEIEMHPFMRTP